jgi:hypothetical protein
MYISTEDLKHFRESKLHKTATEIKRWLEDAYGSMRSLNKTEVEKFLMDEIVIAREKIGLTSEKNIAEYLASSWLMEKSAYNAPELRHIPLSQYYNDLNNMHLYALSIRGKK